MGLVTQPASLGAYRDGIESGCRCPYTFSVFAGSCCKAHPKPSRGKGNDMHVFIGLDVSLVSHGDLRSRREGQNRYRSAGRQLRLKHWLRS